MYTHTQNIYTLLGLLSEQLNTILYTSHVEEVEMI